MESYILGDAFEALPLALKRERADLIFTSMPDMSETLGAADSEDEYTRFIRRATLLCLAHLKPSGFLVICQTDRRYSGRVLPKHVLVCNAAMGQGLALKEYRIVLRGPSRRNLYRFTFSHLLAFTKSGRVPQVKRTKAFIEDIWETTNEKHSETGTWVFDESFARRVVESFSEHAALVVDPFAGRGSTARAARQLGRRWLAVELDPRAYNPSYVTS